MRYFRALAYVPHASGRVDEAISSGSAASLGLRLRDDRASTARAARPTPSPLSLGVNAGASAFMAQPATRGRPPGAGLGLVQSALPGTGRGQGREVAL